MKKLVIIFIFLLGVLLRFIFLFANINQTGSTLHSQALIAKFIMLGKALPLSYPYTHYGDMLRCYVAALMFKILGVSIYVFNLTNILLYSLPTMVFIYFLSKKVSEDKSAAVLSLLFISIPSVTLNMYYLRLLSTCLVPLVLFLSYLISFEGSLLGQVKKRYIYSILGLVIGIGLWNDPIILAFIVIPILFLFIRDRDINFKRNISLFLLFTIIGCLPYIIYNIINPLVSVIRLGSYILNVDKSILQQENVFFAFLNKILEIIIYTPKAMMEFLYCLDSGTLALDHYHLGSLAWLGLPARMIYSISFLYILYIRRKIIFDLFRSRLNINQLKGIDMVLFTVIFAYLTLTILRGYAYTRMAPYYPIIVIFVSIFIASLWQRFKIVSLILIILLLAVNLTSNAVALKKPLIPYKTLINFLENNELYRGYSVLDIAHPVTFMSDEKIIILPTASVRDIGFVEEGLEWPEYKTAVASANKVCYLFDMNHHVLPMQTMTQKLQRMNITYKSKLIDPFFIFYDFSKKPLPEELDLPKLKLRW